MWRVDLRKPPKIILISIFISAEKIQCLLTSLEPNDGNSAKTLTQVISMGFCSLLNMLDDKRLEVQIKALHVFHNISVVSLKVTVRLIYEMFH